MDNTTQTFLDWIRNGLEKPGKTQIGLARYLNIAHPQISMLMQGKRELKVREIPRIASYLGDDPPDWPGFEKCKYDY